MSVSKINFNDKNEAFLTVDSMEFIDKDELKNNKIKKNIYDLKEIINYGNEAEF